MAGKKSGFAEHLKNNHYLKNNRSIQYIKDKGFKQAVFNYLYFLGCWVIRRFRIIRRRISLFFKIHKVNFLKFINRGYRKIRSFAYENYLKVKAPLHRISYKRKSLRKLLRNPDNLDEIHLKENVKSLKKSIMRDIKVYAVGTLNYVLPILSLILMINVFQVFDDTDYLLKVEYNGKDIGYIENENDFYDAEKQMKARITHESYIKPVDAVPRFTIVTDREHHVTPKNTLIDRIISASGNQVIDADGLYINNRFIGAFKDAEELLDFLDYTLKSNESGEPDEKISFVKKIEIKDGLYPVSSLADEDKIYEKLSSTEEAQKTYIVEKGDVPGGIAQKFGMPYEKLKQLNPDIETKLMVGQEVIISAAVPYLGIKRTVTETYDVEIPYKIEKTINNKYNIGYSKVTQDGKPGTKRITAKTTYVDGFETEKNIISSEVVEEPVNQKIVMGGKVNYNQQPSSGNKDTTPSTSVSTNGYIWPTRGGVVTCRIWGYPGHTGQDIAVPIGTPIYAMASGRVVVAKTTLYGYGRHVMIDHGGGVQTLYAHNSQLLVNVGDWVEQGQVIAYSGNSGNSSGPHVHVEFRINGRYVDPGKFIGYAPPR